MARIKDSELKNIAWAHLRDATGYLGNDSEISQERADALKAYLGEPYGDERDGRSKVVSRDILDTVEWILPSLIRVFCSGDDVVRFEPEGIEDEASAKQATEYLNYCFWRKNSGFLTLHTWFKDALIQKNGVVKYFWDKKRTTRIETYTALDEMNFTALVAPDDVKVLEHTANEDGTHDVKIKRVTETGYPCTVPVPPEEFLISRRARSIEDAVFCAHRVLKTRSELIAEGYDEKVVKDLPTYHAQDNTEEEVVRWQRDNDEEVVAAHWSMEEVEVYECYVDVDYDGDDIAECVKVVLAGGEGGKLLSHDMVEEKPFASICPIPMPHKYNGLSIADILQDIQRIKTVLWRNYLDGTYLATTPQREVAMGKLEKGGLDDLLSQKVGGIIRVKELGAVREVQFPDIGAASLTAMEYTDRVRQDRTGVNPGGVALDQDALNNQSATAVNQAAADAAQRIELIARIFAETGVKDLFRGLYRLVVRHQPKEQVIRLRNQWVTIDPNAWNIDMDVVCEVGLGHGNRDRLVGMLMQVLAYQTSALREGLPFVKPENIYATLEKWTAWTGLGPVEPYFSDPQEAPPQQPPPPDPRMLEVQRKQQKDQQDFQVDMAELQLKARDLARKEAEALRDTGQQVTVMDMEQMRLQKLDLLMRDQRERDKMAMEADYKFTELDVEALLEKYAIDQRAPSGNGVIPN